MSKKKTWQRKMKKKVKSKAYANMSTARMKISNFKRAKTNSAYGKNHND